MDLKTKYRPTKLCNFVFLSAKQEKLINTTFNNLQSHTFLFTGNSGLGKTTLARIFARQVGALSDDLGEGIDYFEFNCAAQTGKEDALEFISIIDQPPSFQARVVVLDEAQKLSNSAQNALLKPLENLDGTNNYVIICSSEPDKLINAIKTRCSLIKLELDYDNIEFAVENLVKYATKITKEEYPKLDIVKVLPKICESYIYESGSEFSIRSFITNISNLLNTGLDLNDSKFALTDNSKNDLWELLGYLNRDQSTYLIDAISNAKRNEQSITILYKVTLSTIKNKILAKKSLSGSERRYFNEIVENLQQLDYFEKTNNENAIELLIIKILDKMYYS